MDFASITLAGHLTADPVSRMGKDNREYATFSIAVNQRNGGQEVVSYYDCFVSGFMYQGMLKSGVVKGSSVSVTGMQTIRTYVDREGHNGTSVNVRVLDWRFIGSRPKNEDQNTNSAGPQGQYGYNGYQAQQPQQTANKRPAPNGYQNQAQVPQQPQAGYQAQQNNGYMPQAPQNPYGYGSVQAPVHVGDGDDLPL